ncbi:StAR-related lipid transfer protein 13 [Bagarius yarrelli]|uniref:StAR-related lipid transfer protein 13 n=1 Tax=Bagarius yarrelli TaxID=175774 RepID=A0A556VAA2_BAGYA|nr:StAR-related lipid transfer protein 13 [Bagarius yarrelli]
MRNSRIFLCESLTPKTQVIYLRLDSPHRRSGLRLARIVARQQLLQKIERDSQFPIDITAVERDHDFLDKDLVEPLCRRLQTLNKCASMKLDVGFPKKRSEDSDEDDLLAISNRWTFEWSSRRWSRLQDPDLILGTRARRRTVSSESVLTDLSEPELCSLNSEDSLSAMPESVSLSPVSISQYQDLHRYNTLPAKSSGHGRTRAKDFLRRIETLGRSWGTMRACPERHSMTISGPILQSEPEALRTVRCNHTLNREPCDTENTPSASNCPSAFTTFEMTSQSEMPSESTESTPYMKEHIPELHNTSRHAGMYLENLNVLPHDTQQRKSAKHNLRNEFHSYEDLLVHIPKDHKPGTFPKALSIESLTPANRESRKWKVKKKEQYQSLRGRQWGEQENQPLTRSCPRSNRMSIYDNVPGSHLYASTGDLMDLEQEEDLFPHLDDILQHVNGLQQIVDHWSKNVLPEGGGEVDRGQDHEIMDGQSSSQITLDFEGTSVNTPSDGDRDGVSFNETDTLSTRERRDSGVGASLTRPRLRWPSFRMSNRLSQSGTLFQLSSQSAGQLSLLQKFSLLRLTAIMEKNSMSNKHGWTWSVPKFMKRIKGSEYRDKGVYGVPLIVHVQRYGQPLPICLQLALRFLRRQCLDQVGLFRKSGVKSRIQALRQMCESSPESVDYEDQCAYDVADMVKQFFRDLPEPLLTSKLGETFLHIYQHVPKEQRLQAVSAAIMLMADENREVLQTLLCFLNDVTSSAEENQMTPMNLAVCLAPSLFHLNILKNDNLSPRSIQKKYATGRPDQKDLNENLAATQGLAHMITECNRLFEVPQETFAQSSNSYMKAEVLAPPLDDLCKHLQSHVEEEEEEEASYRCHMEGLIQYLLKESRDKTKCWTSQPSIDNVELAFKKVGDGTPLRRWRISVEVEAPPSVLMNRVLREQHLWDSDLLQWKVLETLDKQTEVYQYAVNNMAPHPSRDFVVLRMWQADLPKGVCALVTVSIEHEDSAAMGEVRGIVLESNYLFEPCGSGKSRLTHICRVDLKGKSPEWYNKAFGHICAAQAARIRNSLQPLNSEGPETRI